MPDVNTALNDLSRPQKTIPINSYPPYELFKQIFDTMNEGLTIGDKDGKGVFINKSFTKMFGYKPEEVLGRKFTDFLDAENRKIHAEQIIKRKKGLSDSYELSVTCKDGQQQPVLISPSPLYDENNNYVGSFGTLTDILNLKLAETEILLRQESLEDTLKDRTEKWTDAKEQLRQKDIEQNNSQAALEISRKRFAQIANTIEDVFWITDLRNDQVLYVSPAYEKVWGQSVESLYKDSQLWTDAIHPDDRQRICKAFDCISEVGSYDQEYRIVRPDGSIRWIRDRGYPVCDQDGELFNIAGLAEDITDKKQAEMELSEKHRQIQMLSSQVTSAEERERKLIAEGLHDNIIQPMIFLDIKLGSLASAQKDDEIIAEYKQMRQIVAGLIEKTRSFTFDLSNPVLYELGLETAMEEWLSSEIETKHGLSVVFKMSGDLNNLSDDISVFIYKAVKELTVNIVKHANAKSAFISVTRNKTGVKICVKDNGKGLDLSNKKKRYSKGSGLGLFSLRERLVHFGGSFDIKSKQDKGTTVNINIPLTSDGHDENERRK
jgi:PAS domain S-box-containing protein